MMFCNLLQVVWVRNHKMLLHSEWRDRRDSRHLLSQQLVHSQSLLQVFILVSSEIVATGAYISLLVRIVCSNYI